MRTLTTVVLFLFLAGPTAGADDAATAAVEYFATRSLELAFATEAAGAAEIRTYELYYTTDGGQTWVAYKTRHELPDEFPFTAPSDGRYGFFIVAIDAAGHRGPTPQPGDRAAYECVIDTIAPQISVPRPVPTDAIYGGSDLVIEWKTHDLNLPERCVTIEWRRRSEDPWQDMTGRGTYPGTGIEQWFSPLASGAIELRLSARDLAGNVGVWTTPAPIVVRPFNGFRGSRALAADPYSTFRRFPLHYRVSGFNATELREVQLWVRSGLGQWKREIDPDRATPYIFEAPEDGTYFFYLRAVSKNGDANRAAPGPDTPADYRVIVDTHPPDGELFIGSGQSTQAHTAGEQLELQWWVDDENLAPRGAKLEVSLDGGRSWHSLTSELKSTDGRGSFTWRPPLIGSQSTLFRLEVRDLAGNRNVIASRSKLRLMNPRVDPKETALEHYQHAMVLARTKMRGEEGTREQLIQSLEHFEVAILYNPSLAEAWHDQGVVQRILGRHSDALQSFKKSHSLRPAEVPFTFSLIRSYLDMGDQGHDADGAYLSRASATLAGVTRESIYAYPPGEYRDLLVIYRFLSEDVKKRRVGE